MDASKAKSFFKSKSEPEPEPSPNVADEPAPPTEALGGEPSLADPIEEQLDEELGKNEGSETNVGGGTNDSDSLPGGDPEPPKQVFQVFISGGLLLHGCDAVIPKFMLWAAQKAGYKSDKKAADMILTKEEFNLLEPLAEPVAQELFQNMSPLMQFTLAIGSVYAGKL